MGQGISEIHTYAVGVAIGSVVSWTQNDAVMAVLFLVFGVNLIAKGIPPLTG